MAKESDKKTGAFELENTGGLLSGLFAEENEFDRRALLRIGTWGATTVGAVMLAVLANHWSLGWRREQVAAADLARQAQQIQALTRESQSETRRLASAIETLNNDRDRLFSRVTVLEQGLDSVTGALARQPSPAAALASPQASAAPPAPPLSPAQPAQAQATPPSVATAAAAPVPAPVTATISAAAEQPHAVMARPDAAKAEAAAPASVVANGPTPAAAAANPSSPTPPAATASLMAKSMIQPAAPAAPKSAELAKPAEVKAKEIKAAEAKTADVKMTEAKTADTKTAEAKGAEMPAALEAAAASSPQLETIAIASPQTSAEPHGSAVKADVQQTDFAVELGSANTLAGLRALWRGVRHLNADLAALSPIIVIKEGNNGLGMRLHLAAGPLKDAAAAAKICAALAARKRSCESTIFDGQRLAMAEDEAKGSTREVTRKGAREPTRQKPEGKLSPESRQNLAKRSRHAKNEEPPPPPPPEPPKPAPTSVFSALFGHH